MMLLEEAMKEDHQQLSTSGNKERIDPHDTISLMRPMHFCFSVQQSILDAV